MQSRTCCDAAGQGAAWASTALSALPLQTRDAPASSCTPSCELPGRDEYVWTPSRLSSWLSEGSSSDTEAAAAPGSSSTAPVKGLCQQEQVPQHLRKLLLLLLQATADSGTAQELIWTPDRLAHWLAANNSQGTTSTPSTSQDTGSDSGQHHAGTAATARAHGLSSYLQHLPIVSRVAAIKGQQVLQQGGGSSSGSDVTGTAWLGSRPAHSDTMQQPSSSSDLQASWAPCHDAAQQHPAAACEVTSPFVQRQPQHHPLPTAALAGHEPPSLLQAQLQQAAGWFQDSAACLGSELQQLQQVAAGCPGSAPQSAAPLAGTMAAPPAGPTPAAAAPPPALAAAGRLPCKGAAPGDYPAVQDNPAWDPTALQEAAAAAAQRLGIPVAAQGDIPVPAAPNAALPRSSAGGSRRSDQLPAGAPQQQPMCTTGPQLGVLMLVHEAGVAAPDVWQAWEGMQAGKVVVRVHLKAGVSAAGLAGQAWLSSRQLAGRVASQWGCISLTAALLSAAAEMLQHHPQLQHIAVVSGQDVPLSLLPGDLRPGLSLFGRFQFGRAFDQAARAEAACLLQQRLGMGRADAAAWGEALCFHHTWLVLDRQLVLALISKQEEVLQVGAVLNERFMQEDASCAADEFMLITAALRHGFARRIMHKKLAAHMSAVRRQHSKQAGPAPAAAMAAAAAALHDEDQSSSSCCTSEDEYEPEQRPAKQQRLGHKVPCSRGSSDTSGSSKAATADVALGRSRRGSSSRSGPTPNPGFSLIGRRIKVWWQMDEAYYTGTVTYYNPGIKRHTIKYDDGDVEIIDLRKEKWHPVDQQQQQHAAASAAGSMAQRPGSSSSTELKARRAQGRGSASGGSSLSADGAGSAPASSQACCALQEGTYGVLLDCCPTLALFDPHVTRHPLTWSSFSECLQVDVHSSRLGSIKLTLLEALGLGPANGALFFRKLAPLAGEGAAQLLACLQLLWRRRALPPTVEELELGKGQ